jgi:Rps23 Pro-64 3,4-dihydroxylase Tpa1-like proline 4-hydroxylase
MQVWSEHLIRNASKFRSIFQSAEAKPGNFISVYPFLDMPIAENILCELLSHNFRRWISYLGEDGKPKSHFQDHLKDVLYITIHRRSEYKIKSIDLIHESLGMPIFCNILQKMTGIEVNEILPFKSSICHLMGPGDFLREHTDFGSPTRRTKLVISLSLCKDWIPQYGGITEFKWDTFVKKTPIFNEAIIFAPHENSMHCVSPIAMDAPLKRFTMTFHYV